jgi:hypothetical protein
LYNHLEKGAVLHEEINIIRFEKKSHSLEWDFFRNSCS